VEGVEGGAAEVGSASHEESTTNSAQGCEFRIIVVSRNVESTTNSLEVFESSDGKELGVVVNLQASNLG